jgi:MFS superfamily sulfate permease-like transporter
LRRIGSTHFATLGLSVAVLAVIVGGTRLSRRIPAALVAVAGAIAASGAFALAARGVATLGSVPGGLPSLTIHFLPRAGELYRVIGCAASCVIVIVAQSAATARAYALRHDEEPAEESDLVGLAAANAAAAITGTFVVNGSPTKTEMVDDAGGRSQLAHLTTAVAVLLVLLFLTGPLALLPTAVLSAIVFLIGVKLVDLRGMAELWRLRREEFWIAAIAATTVVLRDAMDGVAVAALLSLIAHVRHTYRPRTRVLVPRPGGGWDAIPPARDQLAAPGVLAYRFEANLFYANASLFMKEVMALLANASQPVKVVVLDTTGVDDIDFSAAKMLLQLRRELHARRVELAVVVSYHVVLDVLTRFGVIEDASDGSVHHSVDAAVAALRVKAVVPAAIASPPHPGSG